MKHDFRYLLIICMALMMFSITSCNNEMVEPSASTPITRASEIINSNQTISVEEAVQNLEEFLSSSTRSSVSNLTETKRPTKVCVIRNPTSYSVRDSKANTFQISYDSLAYVVQFEGENGCAVLSADKRIGTDVLAILDHDLLELPEQCYASRLTEAYFVDYPMEGDGFFKSNEYGE